MSPSDIDMQSRINQALALLHEALAPYVATAMEETFGEEWAQAAQKGLRDPYLQQKAWDVEALLLIITNNWSTAFQDRLGEVGKSLIAEVHMRKHSEAVLNLDDIYRTLDTIARLLRLIGDPDKAERVRREAHAVMQLQFQQPAPASTPSDEQPPSSAQKPEATPVEPADPVNKADSEARKGSSGEEDQKTNEGDAASWGTEPEETTNEEQGPGLFTKAGAWLRGIRSKKAEDGLTPLELRTRLLDNIEETLWEYRSTRPLPFVQLTIHILATDPRLYQRYDDALEQIEPPFPRAVLESLHHAGFEPLSDLAIHHALYDTAPEDLADAFEKYGSVYVAYARKQPKRSSSATLSVVTGMAEEESYILSSDQRFNVGRLKEVREGSYGHLVRQNDLAFLGEDNPNLDAEIRAINNTVSRKHARIEYDERSGQYFLYKVEGDTVISRRGHDAPVQVLYQPIALEDSDLIYLGRACLRFETEGQ